MQKVDFLIRDAEQLITCAGRGIQKRGDQMRDAGLIGNGAVAVSEGRIVAIGRTDDISRRFAAAEDYDARGKVVCPGFVDPHTHIVFGGDRLDEFELKIKGADYLQILSDGGGILSTVRQTRAVSFSGLLAQSLKRLETIRSCGTTTAEIKTGYGLDAESELKMLDVIISLAELQPVQIVPTFLAAHAVPPEFADDTNAYVDLVCREMLPAARSRFNDSKLFRRTPFFADVFCESGAFDLEQARRILEVARSLGFRLKIHSDEFTNLGGTRLAIDLGAASVDHLDKISNAEIALLASTETIGIVTPAVNFNFGSASFADARAMIDAGCAIALATDYNPGSAPCPSQAMSMAIACRYQKLSPAEALNAATINAAHAVGLGSECGSIETGKRADILVFDTKDYREIAYEFGAMRPDAVFINGDIVDSTRAQ